MKLEILQMKTDLDSMDLTWRKAIGECTDGCADAACDMKLRKSIANVSCRSRSRKAEVGYRIGNGNGKWRRGSMLLYDVSMSSYIDRRTPKCYR